MKIKKKFKEEDEAERNECVIFCCLRNRAASVHKVIRDEKKYLSAGDKRPFIDRINMIFPRVAFCEIQLKKSSFALLLSRQSF